MRKGNNGLSGKGKDWTEWERERRILKKVCEERNGGMRRGSDKNQIREIGQALR